MATSPSATFRFVHLSDFHLCQQPWRTNVFSVFERDLHKHLDTDRGGVVPSREFHSFIYPGSYIPEIQRGAAIFCHAYRGKLDGVIISGDLATTGRGIDLSVARSFIKDLPTSGPFVDYNKPTLQGVIDAQRIHIVPGNHDRYRDDFGTPGSQNFVAMFNSPHMRNWDGEIGWWTTTKQDQTIAFVYADFSLRTRSDAKSFVKGAYGQGRVNQSTFDKLVRKTRELKNRHEAVVWIVHFAPFVCEPNLLLIDFQDLTKAAAQLRVLCTICGHTHDKNAVTDNNHVVLCSGSAGAVDRKIGSRVHVLEFKKDDHVSSVNRKNYLWDWGDNRFKLEQDENFHALAH